MKINDIREILTELGIRPTKSMGQNFLIDHNIIRSQIEFANVTKQDTVLEIGAGLGTLTLELASAAKKVITIEKDKKLAEYLMRIIPENVELIEGDALELDWPKFDKLVANLPYKISSPLSFKLANHKFRSATLMYQREFADRVTASPGSKKYGRLTVNLYYYFESKILMNVKKRSFYPIPKVDSAVVQLVPRKEKLKVMDEELFFKLVNVVFNQRRKKIKNSLKNKGSLFNIPVDKYSRLLGESIYQDRRPEELTPEQLVDLANMFVDYC
jgi:16S rRNA (adenine1518-N6/adenine1519-N6)-dimethyltransferase